MNKKILYSIIGTFLIINIVILFKIIKIEKDIENGLYQFSFIESTLKNEISNSYSNIEEKFKKQGSILDNYNLMIEDKLNTETFTVPVTVTITPKEYKEGMTASLDINDKIINMEKKGASFTVKADSYIFNDLNIKVIIEQDGVQKIETIEEVVDLKSKFILKINNGYIDGQAGFLDNSNRFKINGKIELGFAYKEPLTNDVYAENTFEKLSIIKEKNGNIFGEEETLDMPKDGLLSSTTVAINEEVIVEKGDTLTIYAKIEDSYGLVYKYVIANYEVDSHGNPIQIYNHGSQGDYVEISDKDGNLIYNLPRD